MNIGHSSRQMSTTGFERGLPTIVLLCGPEDVGAESGVDNEDELVDDVGGLFDAPGGRLVAPPRRILRQLVEFKYLCK